MAAFLSLLWKSKLAKLTSFIGEYLKQQVSHLTSTYIHLVNGCVDLVCTSLLMCQTTFKSTNIWNLRTLSGATTLIQSGPGNNVNEGLLHFLQSSSNTETSPSDCLVSYLEHSLDVGSYPTVKMRSVYSLVQANWAVLVFDSNTWNQLTMYINRILH